MLGVIGPEIGADERDQFGDNGRDRGAGVIGELADDDRTMPTLSQSACRSLSARAWSSRPWSSLVPDGS